MDLKRFRKSHKQSIIIIIIIVHNFLLCPEHGSLIISIQVGPVRGKMDGNYLLCVIQKERGLGVWQKSCHLLVPVMTSFTEIILENKCCFNRQTMSYIGSMAKSKLYILCDKGYIDEVSIFCHVAI